MGVSSIDVALFKKMVINGAINLKNNQKEVDELNVFPVPDGDTGTNMSMTIMSGVRELESFESSSIIDNAKVLSRGALMGARGNSGVILSQFFRGLYVGLKDIQHDYLDTNDLMVCLDSGCKIAYKAVMEPVEGTILTVVREAAEKTQAKLDTFNNVNDLMRCYFEEAKASLSNTPNLLPVLKEAGVVDSGGAGFCKIIEGMLMALDGVILQAKSEMEKKQQSAAAALDVDIKYGYCTEFIVDLKKPDSFDEKDIKSGLSLMGDSLVCVRDENLLKIHVHTNRPGKVLEMAQKYGEFVKLKIENMRLQHSELKEGAKEEASALQPRKKFALVSVCFGDGIVSTFKDLGVDYVIEGGQTMNPSTEAFVEAIKTVNADNVIIIPNNSNVIMAAKQAANMVPHCNVEVVKAKTIAQGYASIMNFDPEADMETNLAQMTESILHVTSGEITYSIRDTEIGGIKINANDFMGIVDGEIIVSTKEKTDALTHLLKKCITDESQIVTFFCGKDVTKSEISSLENICASINSDVDVEIIEGKQDIYSYIIAVE